MHTTINRMRDHFSLHLDEGDVTFNALMDGDELAQLMKEGNEALSRAPDVALAKETLETIDERYDAKAVGPDAVELIVGGSTTLATRHSANKLFVSLGTVIGSDIGRIYQQCEKAQADLLTTNTQLAACRMIARGDSIEGADMPPDHDSIKAVLELYRRAEDQQERLKKLDALVVGIARELFKLSLANEPNEVLLDAMDELHKAAHIANGTKCEHKDGSELLATILKSQRKGPKRAESRGGEENEAPSPLIAALMAFFASLPDRKEGADGRG